MEEEGSPAHFPEVFILMVLRRSEFVSVANARVARTNLARNLPEVKFTR